MFELKVAIFDHIDRQLDQIDMLDISTTERRLLSALKQDGRASITALAGSLGVSRATVQTKLERLIRSGIITRFTIETDLSAEVEFIRAVMLIEVEGPRTKSVTVSLKRLIEITSLHTTNGAWDLVANIEAASLSEFDRVLREVREIAGVLNSETCLLLNRAGF
jgi:DNA-binding Lrp family transcriptional regulator